MKTVHEFTEKELKHFNNLLEQVYDRIDWHSVSQVINIYDSEGPSDRFWEVYEDAVTPIADPYAVLLEAGIDVDEVSKVMFTDMADAIEQNPDSTIKYWSHCQDDHWITFCKIVEILNNEGY